MKVIGIIGSPRKGGNTEILVSLALEAAQETGAEEIEVISLSGKHINPCDGCDTCDETGECHQNDDMQSIYPKLLEADGIIIGTPVYFWGVSAQVKALIDRTHSLTYAHRAMMRGNKTALEHRHEGLRNKVGGIIVVARRAGATPAVRAISDFFVSIVSLKLGRLSPMLTKKERSKTMSKGYAKLGG